MTCAIRSCGEPAVDGGNYCEAHSPEPDEPPSSIDWLGPLTWREEWLRLLHACSNRGLFVGSWSRK